MAAGGTLARALFEAQEATTGCLSRELWQLYLKVSKDLPLPRD